MVQEAARKGVDIICFPEVFLAPFFPNRLIQDYEKHFLRLPNPVTEPLFAAAREHKVAMIFAYAERDGAYFYNSAAVFDRAGRSGRHLPENPHPRLLSKRASRRHGLLREVLFLARHRLARIR